MPELPDVALYLEAIDARIVGHVLEQVRLKSPFLLRTFDPPLSAVHGKRVVRLARLGKRIAIGLEGQLWLVIHLMIAGRLHWKPAGAKLPGKMALAAFDFDNGTLTLTEAGAKRRAALYLVAGDDALAAHDPGGIDVFSATPELFAAALQRENHTLKRVLTDPHVLSGIGNAYSDEILHRAHLSPFAQSQKLSAADLERLHVAVREVLAEWLARLREQANGAFPEKVTAFHPEMAVHGRFRQPCPVCAAPVQRIRYADHETNYCPGCQTGGQILADRSLSRLLKDSWPRHLDEL
jgi:formamidopyrimidine-DNA glycosylase